MSISLHRAAARRPVRTILLAGLISFTLIGSGGVALAAADPDPSSETSAPAPTTETTSISPSPTESSPAEEPPPPAAEERNQQQQDPDPADDRPEEQPSSTVQVIGACDANDVGSLVVDIKNASDGKVTYKVTFSTSPDLDPISTKELELEAGSSEQVRSGKLDPGDYHVSVTGTDGTDFKTDPDNPAFVDRCTEFEPPDDPLQVFVRCEDGKGLLTIRVFNLDENTTKTFTISIDHVELEFEEPLEIEPGVYVRVDLLTPAPDGTYEVQVTADGVDHSESVLVACAPEPTTPTTTTTPVPQARPAANTGGLASTGAAVGGVAALGLLAFGLGGGLIIASRRRRVRPSEGTDA